MPSIIVLISMENINMNIFIDISMRKENKIEKLMYSKNQFMQDG